MRECQFAAGEPTKRMSKEDDAGAETEVGQILYICICKFVGKGSHKETDLEFKYTPVYLFTFFF